MPTMHTLNPLEAWKILIQDNQRHSCAEILTSPETWRTAVNNYTLTAEAGHNNWPSPGSTNVKPITPSASVSFDFMALYKFYSYLILYSKILTCRHKWGQTPLANGWTSFLHEGVLLRRIFHRLTAVGLRELFGVAKLMWAAFHLVTFGNCFQDFNVAQRLPSVRYSVGVSLNRSTQHPIVVFYTTIG